MSESILNSVKKLLGIAEDYEHFDADIMMHINMALMVLSQLGVGPSPPFMITDRKATWEDFLGDSTDLLGVKTYIYLKVRLVFDPPQSSAAVDVIKENIAELEWRLNAAVDPKHTFTATEEDNNRQAIANRINLNNYTNAITRLSLEEVEYDG